MAIEIPTGAMCFRHLVHLKGIGDVCANIRSESVMKSLISVDDLRAFYTKQYINKQKTPPEIKVYFEPVGGDLGAFYFVVKQIPETKHGDF